MVPVPVTVRLVDVVVFQDEDAPVNVHVPDPTATVLLVETLELNETCVKLYPFRSKVPLFNWKVTPAVDVRASCKVREPDGESTYSSLVNAAPAVVNV